jgi:hypothetical protein
LKVVKKISLADCFAAALASGRAANTIGDPEFKTVGQKSKSFGYSASCSSKNTQYAITTILIPMMNRIEHRLRRINRPRDQTKKGL